MNSDIVGTTANVSVKLSGENGSSSGVRHLYRPGSFQRGSRDVFVVATDRSLGRVMRLAVWHDNAGTTPGWYLSTVTVRDLHTGICYQFIADTWLTLSTLADHGEIEKELRCVGKNAAGLRLYACAGYIYNEKALRETQTLRARRSPPIDTQSPRWL